MVKKPRILLGQETHDETVRFWLEERVNGVALMAEVSGGGDQNLIEIKWQNDRFVAVPRGIFDDALLRLIAKENGEHIDLAADKP